MAPSRRDVLHRFLAARVAEHRMPAATWWVGTSGGAISRGAVGTVHVGPDAPPAEESTPFDLASLTKPLATALLLVLLEQDGRLDLDTPLERYVQASRGFPVGSCTIVSLATHMAGLRAWQPLFLRASSLAGYVDEIVRQRPAGPPGATLYSDSGYVLLGALIEAAAGKDLARLFDERIAGPLGLERTGFATGLERFADAAATERGNEFERAMAGDEGASHAWRAEIPRGQVHDVNAHGLGGVAGHAGLFGTSEEVARICGDLLRPRILPLGTRARSRLLRVVPASAGRTVGMVAAASSAAGRGVLPDDAPGHTGFTGTSFWLDPASGACYVLLTNRIHPRVPDRDFSAVRRGFHRLAAAVVRRSG